LPALGRCCSARGWRGSRYRVVVPLREKTMASVVIGLDRTLRRVDGVTTYALTDDEKTVAVEHVCGSRSGTLRWLRSRATTG
jgi:hypothetical protein